MAQKRKHPQVRSPNSWANAQVPTLTDGELNSFKIVCAPGRASFSALTPGIPPTPGVRAAALQPGPASTPAPDLLSRSLPSGCRVDPRVRVLGHTGRSASVGRACGLGWAQDLLLTTQYFRVQAAGLSAPAGKLQG